MRKRAEMMQGDVLRRHCGRPFAHDVPGELCKANSELTSPTVHRPPTTLTERGRDHRLGSLNAIAASGCGHPPDAAIRLICDDWGAVEAGTAPTFLSELSSLVGKLGFAPLRYVIEIHGVRSSCGWGQVTA